MLSIRPTILDDLDKIDDIFNIARAYMASYGDGNQWAGTYPSKDNVRQDIEDGNAYSVIDNNEVVGYFAFIIGEDPHYINIYDGKWLNNDLYGTIHRIASNNKVHRVFEVVLDYCFKKVDNVRIDTHENNVVMRHLIEKNGFNYCGIVYMDDNSPRLAFQLCKKY